MTCQWCDERHGADQLCQRAQRGMTRRSFCFLFGAGLAGAALATKPAAVESWYVDHSDRLHVLQADEWTVIENSINRGTVASFRTSARLDVGRRVAIDYQGQRLFEGILLKTNGYPGLPIDNVAQDTATFMASRFRPS